MRGGVARFGVTALVAAAVLSGCGDGGAGERLDRAGFLARGNALCAEAERSILTAAESAFPDEGQVPSAEQIESFVAETFIPEIRNELDGLRDLRPPEEDQERVRDILREGEDALEEVSNRPLSLASPTMNPFRDYEELAGAYGLEACGEISGKTRRLMSGVPG